jgi:DNA-binding CsgD family transcriptional regulator
MAGRLRTITARQTRVLRLIANGHTTQQAADALNVSVRTVRSDLAAAQAELGAQTRSQTVAVAQRVGLLRPGDINVPATEGSS